MRGTIAWRTAGWLYDQRETGNLTIISLHSLHEIQNDTPANGGTAELHLAPHHAPPPPLQTTKSNNQTRQSPTRGRTHHFVADVIYLQKLQFTIIQVCFSSTLPDLVFPVSLSPEEKEHFSACYLELYPVALTYKLDLDRVKVNHHAKYLGRRPFRSTDNVQTHRHKHTYSRPIALSGPQILV